MDRQMTTPFGRRPLALAHVAAQVAARSTPPQKAVHKWKVFRDLCAARDGLGVTDRALAVLNALLSFHQETALTGGDLVVYPSNQQLSLRANGMAASTLRRHIAQLVDRGLVIRRDSPNGKRYARKGRGGQIELAFGFDLSPLVARGDEIEALAEEARAEERAVRLAREQITLLRRDIAKMIEMASEESVEAPEGAGWPAVEEAFLAALTAIPRVARSSDLTAPVARLADLAAMISITLERHVFSQQMSANESRTERHKQNSKPKDLNENEGSAEEVENDETIVPPIRTPAVGSRPFPLSMVLQGCPDIADYAKGGVRSWQDLIAAAGVVRSFLGVSASAWKDAQEVLGPEPAAIAVACILQRQEAISAPGGYLRSLVERAKVGQFSIGPMLLASFRARAKEGRLTG